MKIGKTYYNTKECLKLGKKKFIEIYKDIVPDAEELWYKLGGKKPKSKED